MVSSEQLKEELCSEKTKPINVVYQANKLLNEKIAKVGFVGIPPDVQFIRYVQGDKSYHRCFGIYHKAEFDQLQRD